jgi:hypothetical protein
MAPSFSIQPLLPKPGKTEPSQKWSYVKAVKAEGGRICRRWFLPGIALSEQVISITAAPGGRWCQSGSA